MRAILLIHILLLTGCMCPHQFLPKADPPQYYHVQVPEKIRVALVLGSGGVRGMAHVGVLEELEKENIPIDLIIGCSAGSLVGSLYADNPDAGYVKKAVATMRSDTLLDINLWECRFGLSQGQKLLKVLDENLEAQNFDDLKIPLIVVATDLHSGELVPIGTGDLTKAVQASCSIPFVFVPVELNGRILVDGGVVNPVPVCIPRDLGAKLIIAVDLCELLPVTFPTNLFGVAKRSAEIAFLWQNEICTRHSDVIIRPKMCGVGAFNDKLKWQLYEAGREAAREAIPRIKELISLLSESELEPCPKRREVSLHCYGQPVRPI